VLSGLAPAAAAASSQSGMVGIPDSNVTEDLPANGSAPISASDLVGSVMSSAHASSLEVVVTTPERASSYVNGSRVGSGEVALVFRDDQNHDGRRVAVPADAVRAAVGYVPEVVHGVHDSGESWTAEVSAESGVLTFKIPRFSSNTVTFSGTVELVGDPATDGTSYSYSISNLDSVSDFHINLTGSTTTEAETEAGSKIGDADSLPISVGGNADPETANITLTGIQEIDTQTDWSTGLGAEVLSADYDGSRGLVYVSGNQWVKSLYLSNGTVKWSYSGGDVGSGNNSGVALSPDGSMLYVGTGNGYIEALDPETGASQWSQGISSDAVNGVAVGPEHVYGVDFNGYLDAVGRSSHSVNWTYDNGGPIWDATFHPSTNNVYLSTSGEVVAINKNDNQNKNWSYYIGSSTHMNDVDYSPSSQRVFTVTDSGKLVAVSAGSEEWTHTSTFSDSVRAVEVGPNGNVVYTLTDSQKLTAHATADGGLYWEHSGVAGTHAVDVSPSNKSLVASNGTEATKLSSATKDPSASIGGSTVVSHSGTLADGETVSSDVSLSTADSSVEVSTGTGSVDLSLDFVERTVSENITVETNGNDATYTGQLLDGETHSLATDTGWIKSNNQINVSVGPGGLSEDAPAPEVELKYTHEANTEVSTTYVGDGLSESYNVSKTYGTAIESPSLEIPFSQTVYEIPQLEQRTNGGDWSDVPTDHYTLKDTHLTVQLDDGDGDGDVEAGDQVEIRATGYKFDTVNGQVTVTDPTDPDDSGLDAEISVDTRSNGFHLELGTSRNGHLVHYTHTESYDKADEYAVLGAGGSQELYLPNAGAGDTARITTIPLEVLPDSGETQVHVADPDGPTFTVMPGGSVGDLVTFRYHAITSGTTYRLESISRGRTMDSAEAGAEYVALQEDDSEETFKIEVADSGGGSDGSDGGGVPGSWEAAASDPSLQDYGVIAGWALLVVLLTWVTGKSRAVRGRVRLVVIGSVTVAGALLTFEILAPGSISSRIGQAVGEIVPVAGLAAVGIIGYSIVQWWRNRQKKASTPETKVNLELGGGND